MQQMPKDTNRGPTMKTRQEELFQVANILKELRHNSDSVPKFHEMEILEIEALERDQTETVRVFQNAIIYYTALRDYLGEIAPLTSSESIKKGGQACSVENPYAIKD